MAKLSPEQAISLINAPVHKDKIAQAVKQEERLIFHCEPVQETKDLSSAYQDHLVWVSKFLPPDKMKRYVPLLTAPVDTVQSTKTIFNELSKVFRADNRFIKFEFVTEEIETEANEYRARLNDEEFWKTEGFKALKIGINSIVVVDLPSVQLTPRPEPYYYLVNIKTVIDVEFFENGRVSYLIFKRRDGKIVVIDEQSYMVFQKPDQGDIFMVSPPAIHSFYDQNDQLIDGLGYAPAKSYYKESIINTEFINKRGPLTDVLAKLDWLLFWRVSKKYFELYATWPLMVAYKRTCKYQDEEGNQCVEGFINYTTIIANGNGIGEQITHHQKACPSCSAQSSLGPGTKWEVDAPLDKDDVDLMLNPIKFIEVTTDKLDFVVTELERLENEIYLDVVGWDGDAITKEAVNEKQVDAGFVSKEAVLDVIKGEGQETQKFAMDTVFVLRYGNYFLRSVVDWGTNYFLKTEGELIEELQAAKNAGLPAFMIAEIRDKINRTANKNNPDRLTRNQILEQLEPYLDYKVGELIAFQVTDRDPINYIIKLNFNNFIQRFERENMNIVQFGSKIDFKQKISIIKQKLESYAKEQTVTIPRVDAPTN